MSITNLEFWIYQFFLNFFLELQIVGLIESDTIVNFLHILILIRNFDRVEKGIAKL